VYYISSLRLPLSYGRNNFNFFSLISLNTSGV